MSGFNIGDFVQMGIPEEDFRRRASDNSSTRSYIKHIANGGIAEVASNDGASIRLKVEEIGSTSNWFKIDWFEPADTTLHKIKLESQRL